MGHNTQFAGPRAADGLSAPRGETLLPFPPQPKKHYRASARTRGNVRESASQQDELRARPVRTRIAGQVRVRTMQAGQTRSCGVRAHTHKHPRTETPAVGSHAACAAALPSGSPPPRPPSERECLLVHNSVTSTSQWVRQPEAASTQFRTVENLSTVQPHKLRPCFRSPPKSPNTHTPTDSHGLWGALEQYLSDPWAPGHAVLCVWKPERRSFTHSRSHARSLEVRFLRSQ